MTEQPLFQSEKTLSVDYNIIMDDVLTGLSKLHNEIFELIITSPPYNLGKEYEQKTDLQDYLNFHEQVIVELHRVCSKTGSIAWQVGNFVENGEVFPLDIYFYPIFKKLGFKLRNRIIWHFNHGLHSTKRLSGRYETLLWFTKSDDYIFNLDSIRVPAKYPNKRHYKGEKRGKPSGNPLGKNPSDFWDFLKSEFESGIFDFPNVKSNHPEKEAHPCQFPVELVERCVLAFTNEGGHVLDPFAGVGTTAIASLKNSRNSVSIEISTDYCNIARQRIKKFLDGFLRLRPMGKQIHKPKSTDKLVQIPAEWIE